MNSHFFSARHLFAGYGEKQVLTDLSFSLEAGTLTALLGANGCGKTTLLRCVCQSLPYEGSCVLGQEDLKGLSHRQLSKSVSYIPQKSGITISLSALHVVLMGFHSRLKLLQQPSAAQKEAAAQALHRVGIAPDADYQTLSEGQKQLCILARTLVEDTQLLLLDEPDSALDFYNRYHLMKTLQQMTQGHQRAALLCLHDPQLALSFCHQLLLLQDGRLLHVLHPACDPLSEMERWLQKLYGPLSLQACYDQKGRRRLLLLSELD